MSRIGEMFNGGFGVLAYYSKRFIAESRSGEVEEVDLSAISSTTLNDLFPNGGVMYRSAHRRSILGRLMLYD